MMFLSRQAKITSLQALCLGAVCVLTRSAAAQSGDVDLFPVTPGNTPAPAPAPLGAPAERAPTDLFVSPEPLPSPSPSPSPSLPHHEPRARPTRWDITGGLSGSIYTIHPGPYANTDFDQQGNRGSASVGPIVFLTPVVDNDAPRSLQPFLQRTSSVYGDVFGGGFVTRHGNGAFTRTDSLVGADAGADVYLTRHLALTGGIRYAYDVLHDDVLVRKGHSFSGSAGVGARIGDARIDASYGFGAYNFDGSFVKPGWGSVGLSAYLLLAESFAITLSGHVNDRGGGGGLNLGLYATKDFGVFAGFSGATFTYTDSDVRSNRYNGSAGFSYWATPALRFYWSYVLGVNSSPSQPLQEIERREIEHALSASVVARLP